MTVDRIVQNPKTSRVDRLVTKKEINKLVVSFV